LDHTVFFTVARNGRGNYRSRAILEILANAYGASTAVLAHFEGKMDAKEVGSMTALVDLSADKFSGLWRVAKPNSPGLPEWARAAKAVAVIGSKAVANPMKMNHCAKMVFHHFPHGYLSGNSPFNRFNDRRGKRK
jgi:hypothetical protein